MRHAFVTNSLAPGAAARRLSLVLPNLVRGGANVAVAMVERGGLFADPIRTAGAEVICANARGAFDPFAAWELCRLLRAWAPDAVHVLEPLPGTVRWLLKRTFSKVVRETTLPAMAVPVPVIDRAAVRARLGLMLRHRVIVASDRFESAAAGTLAVWALDLLKPTSPDYALVLLGDGPKRSRVEAFARKLGADDPRTIFTGALADALDILAAADCVWSTRSRGGEQFAGEAVQLGVPVMRKESGEVTVGVTAVTAFDFARATHEIFNGKMPRNQTIAPHQSTLCLAKPEDIASSILQSHC